MTRPRVGDFEVAAGAVHPDRVDLEYREDYSVKVKSIDRSTIVRIEPHESGITREQQLWVLARFGLIIGAVVAVFIWILVLGGGQIATGVVESILLTAAAVLVIGAIVTVYNLPKIAWSPLAAFQLTLDDGKSLEVFVKEDRANELMARLDARTGEVATYSKVIVVGEISDTPLFKQAEGMLVRSIASAPNHPLAPDVEFVTEGVAELPAAEKGKVEPFVWALQARHGKRGGAWQVDFHAPMGFSFMVVYLE